MTNKEMTEAFSILMLAYPKAEMFQGGIEKLAPTIKLWTSCFKDIPVDSFTKAIKGLVMSSPYPPTIAEVTKKLRQNILGNLSATALWHEFNEIVDKMLNIMYYFGFTSYLEDSEDTVGVNARRRAKDLFESIKPIFKAYVGSYSGMLAMCKRLQNTPDSSLGFEQNRFDKFVESYIERQDLSDLPLLVQGSAVPALEGGQNAKVSQ